MSLPRYRTMFVFAMFDLPVTSDQNKKDYRRFRTALLKDGFDMLQYSVYIRFCANEDSAKKHRSFVRDKLPPHGSVNLLTVTERQFELMENFIGKKREKTGPTVTQLELF